MHKPIDRYEAQILSLFCGAGGLDKGFSEAGFETIFAVDNCADAVASFNHNAGHEIAIKLDLASLTGEKFLELIPKRRRADWADRRSTLPRFFAGKCMLDPNDPRNLLPYRYADLLASANERYGLDFFVFENVAGLLGPKHAQRFGRIVERLESAGFKVFHCDLDAKSFSVPQRRRRLFVVGLNKKRYPNVEFEFPKGNEKLVTVADVLRDLPAPTFFSRGLLPEQVAHHRNHWTMVPKSGKFKGGTTTDGRSFKRLRWDQVSPTVAYGHREVHVHPDGTRRLSIYEALLLQGFRKEFELVGFAAAHK